MLATPRPIQSRRLSSALVCIPDDQGVHVKEQCEVSGCDRTRHGRRFCQVHYKRYKKYGDPGSAEILTRGGSDSYVAIHDRLRRERGSASSYDCEHCGQPATDWAYDHDDPYERSNIHRGRIAQYSIDINHYLPLCRQCHTRFDIAHRPPMICAHDGCNETHYGRAFCRKHYDQWYRRNVRQPRRFASRT